MRSLEIDTNKISKIFPTSLLKPIARQHELFIDLMDCKSIHDFIISGIEKRENKGVGAVVLAVKSTNGSEIKISGPMSLLNILEERIPEYVNEYWIEVAQAVKIPGSTEIFIGQINAIKKATKECLDDHDIFQKSLDQIIFKLFNINSLGEEAIETIKNSLA